MLEKGDDRKVTVSNIVDESIIGGLNVSFDGNARDLSLRCVAEESLKAAQDALFGTGKTSLF